MKPLITASSGVFASCSTLLAILALFTILVVTSCTAAPTYLLTTAWAYSDLRALDPDDAPESSLDLLAVYTRTSGEELQIRLDWLDHPPLPEYDLYLALDAAPGGIAELPLAARAGIEWDTLLVIPASGALQALNADLKPRQNTALFVLRDPVLDTLTLSLRYAALMNAPPVIISRGWENAPLRLQVFLTHPETTQPIEVVGPLRTDDSPPATAPLLLAFWNAYPAYSPALALRRWDGAHTGPYGDRHGLFNLLRTANGAGIPLVLLDLKTPASLAALDYRQSLDLLREMEAAGMLILPEYLPSASPPLPPYQDAYIHRLASFNRQISRDFNLPASPFVYAPAVPLAGYPGARVTFARLRDEASLQPTALTRWRDQVLVPIYNVSGDSPQQASLEGLSLEVRRALIATALANQPTSAYPNAAMLILGGDLPTSAWGDPQMARAAFHYLASRPWIHPLTAHDLLAARPSLPTPPLPGLQAFSLPCSPAPLLQAHTNPLQEAAWQTYLSLYSPIFPEAPALPELRASYLGQVCALLQAARWAEAPAPIADCSTDPDQDGQPECVLASERFYAQFEIESGTLTTAFARLSDTSGNESLHQLIAPSSQFVVGLSDASTWDLSAGLSADPAVIPGAFAEPGAGYLPSLEGNALVFTSTDGARRKIYRLLENGIRVEYEFLTNPGAITLRMPLALDPWSRNGRGWADRYQSSISSQAMSWSLQDSLRLEIRTTATLFAYDFTASQPFMSLPENPNQDYPSGHFLPFPLALVEFIAKENFSVELLLFPNSP